MYNEKIHTEIDIDAPVSKVFEFLTDPNNIPLILPGLKENYDIPELPIKEGSKCQVPF
ncbi:SRPBCC family protein [Candidatus Daviesbacteria bacterium]|nr:SRPBCC family protein [Candidatus Daviesbacteria bacterium]